jgi:acyl carrier protein
MALTIEQVTEKVHQLLMEHLDVSPEQLTRDAKVIHDLGAEELDLVDIETAIEDAFGIEPLYADQEPMQPTVADLIDRVLEQLQNREAAR